MVFVKNDKESLPAEIAKRRFGGVDLQGWTLAHDEGVISTQLETFNLSLFGLSEYKARISSGFGRVSEPVSFPGILSCPP